MSYAKMLLAFFAFVSSPRPVFAWGYDGHRIIAEIAEQFLEPQTVQRVRELGSDPADEAFFYTARVLTGNLTLISGMVAANQPWRLLRIMTVAPRMRAWMF